MAGRSRGSFHFLLSELSRRVHGPIALVGDRLRLVTSSRPRLYDCER